MEQFGMPADQNGMMLSYIGMISLFMQGSFFLFLSSLKKGAVWHFVNFLAKLSSCIIFLFICYQLQIKQSNETKFWLILVGSTEKFYYEGFDNYITIRDMRGSVSEVLIK